MEPATLRLYSWSSVLQAKAPKKSAGKTQIWEREKNVLKQQQRTTFIILYDDQVVASGSPQLLFVVVSLALTFKFCLSPLSLCYRLTPIGAALSCKKDAKRPKLAQNSLRWPILPVSIGGGKVVNLRSVWVMWGLTTVILIIWTHWVDRRAPTQAPLLSFAAF